MDTLSPDPFATADDYVSRHGAATDAGILRELLAALREDSAFDLQRLYELNLSNFDLAVELLSEWRLQRYYRGHAVVAAALPSQ